MQENTYSYIPSNKGPIETDGDTISPKIAINQYHCYTKIAPRCITTYQQPLIKAPLLVCASFNEWDTIFSSSFYVGSVLLPQQTH